MTDQPFARFLCSRLVRLALPVLLLSCGGCASDRSDERTADRGGGIPVIYCTDLFHPHDDPDDHFDIAALYALDELDLRAIVLDQGERQAERPGSIPVRQLNALTGRSVPYAVGLARPLSGPADDARDRPAAWQAGLNLIIDTLEEARAPVTIITVGSLRDVATAFNRRPDLFTNRVGRLMIFIGEASAPTREWNVGLDPAAFIRIMNSGLPIWWVPCFDGGNFHNRGRASFWRAAHTDLLHDAADPVMNFFIYALIEQEAPDPIAYLAQNVDEDARRTLLGMTRNLWCTAVLTAAADRAIIEREGRWVAVPADRDIGDEHVVEAFRFSPVSLFVDDEARVRYEVSARAHEVMRFEIANPDRYAQIMTSVTAALLGELPATYPPSLRPEGRSP